MVLQRETFLNLTEEMALGDSLGNEADKQIHFEEKQGLGAGTDTQLEAHLNLAETLGAGDRLLLQSMQRSLDEKLIIQDTVSVSVTRRR